MIKLSDKINTIESKEECNHELIGVEYEYGHPARYDGVSEWLCGKCGLRTGRWSGKILQEGEFEYRWGQPPYKASQKDTTS